MKQGILQRKKSFQLASPACSFCSLLLAFAQLPPASSQSLYNLIVPGVTACLWQQVPSGEAFLYFCVLLICICKWFLFPLYIFNSLPTSPRPHILCGTDLLPKSSSFHLLVSADLSIQIYELTGV